MYVFCATLQLRIINAFTFSEIRLIISALYVTARYSPFYFFRILNLNLVYSPNFLIKYIYYLPKFSDTHGNKYMYALEIQWKNKPLCSNKLHLIQLVQNSPIENTVHWHDTIFHFKSPDRFSDSCSLSIGAKRVQCLQWRTTQDTKSSHRWYSEVSIDTCHVHRSFWKINLRSRILLRCQWCLEGQE